MDLIPRLRLQSKVKNLHPILLDFIHTVRKRFLSKIFFQEFFVSSTIFLMSSDPENLRIFKVCGSGNWREKVFNQTTIFWMFYDTTSSVENDRKFLK